MVKSLYNYSKWLHKYIGLLLVGSFNGLYRWERSSGRSINLLTGQEAQDVSPVRPAQEMITTFFTTPQGEAFVNTHQQGLMPIGSAWIRDRFALPDEMGTSYRMPLWNYLFEIHNGRFFKDLIGAAYILLVPLGFLLFVMITLSGAFDWVYLQVIRKYK